MRAGVIGDGARPVLVAGASGFVGSHTARLLVERGRTVRVLLRPTSSRAALVGLPIEIVAGDVLDPASLRQAMRGCTTVFYSVVDPRFWLTDQTPIFRNNVQGLMNAMDAALACGIERFVFTSTMGTLGLNPDGPVTEDIPLTGSTMPRRTSGRGWRPRTAFLRVAGNGGCPVSPCAWPTPMARRTISRPRITGSCGKSPAAGRRP